jgi:RNA polymerase sigma-70 factor, ECF subfamily
VRGGGIVNVADLFEETRDSLLRYALSLSRRLDRADDLVQETFVRALMHAGDLEHMNLFQQDAWLKRVLRNRFYDEQRAQQRHLRLVRLLLSDHQRPGGNTDLPDYDALLESVPSEYQELFEMRYRLGMNSTEIAHQLDEPPGTIRYRLHRCIQSLRRQMPQAVRKE